MLRLSQSMFIMSCLSLPQMIILANPTKPFEYTPKGTPRRHAIIPAYSDEIAAIYKAVDESSQTELTPPGSWDAKSVHAFVRKVVDKVLVESVADNDDLFQHGCDRCVLSHFPDLVTHINTAIHVRDVDSLQATWIRNSILYALRHSSETAAANEISPGFVYTHPSVGAMTSIVTQLVARRTIAGTGGPTSDPAADKLAEMKALICEYTTGIRQHVPGRVQPQGDVILLTGSTGSFGPYLLENLLASPEVARVYALNHRRLGGRETLEQRHEHACADKGIDFASLMSGKLVLMEGDTSLPGFGIPGDLFEEMRASVTHIIHNGMRFVIDVSNHQLMLLKSLAGRLQPSLDVI